MSRLGINLATRPFRNNLLIWTGLAFAFASLAAASYANAHLYGKTGAEMRAYEEELAEGQRTFRELNAEIEKMSEEVRRMDLKALNDRAGFVNGVILGRLFSWTTLFDRLETIVPETVRLRSIRPSISKDGIEVRVDGLAQDYASILRFEEALLDSTWFSHVYPLQETSREGQSEIQFNLVFGYLPSGREEEPIPAVLEEAPPAGEEAGEGSPTARPAGEDAPPAAGPEDAGAAEADEEFGDDEEEEAPEEERR
jgi:Tfp pilus assembly protein PilN